jgi:hypothetical protein
MKPVSECLLAARDTNRGPTAISDRAIGDLDEHALRATERERIDDVQDVQRHG